MNDLAVCKLNRLPHMCGPEGARTDKSLRERLIRAKWLRLPTPQDCTPFYNIEALPVLKLDRIGARAAVTELQSWQVPSDAKRVSQGSA